MVPPYYYALIRVDDRRVLAFYVGKGFDPTMDKIELLLEYPKLMAFTMWYGEFPEIVSEYELDEMEMKGIEVIEVHPKKR